MTLRDKRDPYVYEGSWLQEASDEVEKHFVTGWESACIEGCVSFEVLTRCYPASNLLWAESYQSC